jgi:hypothetical protein
MAYDISVIRPEMRFEQVKPRGQGLSPDRKAGIKRALNTLHTMEIMAATIYKCQITSKPCALNTRPCATR